MDNRIELCKCGHDRFMHDCKEYECLVHDCSCTLYSEPQVDKAYLNFEPPEKPQVCPECSGFGSITIAGCSGTKNTKCPKCNGTGKVPTKQVVCPKPKQMMICPKASEGNQSGYYGNANPEEYLLHGGKPLPPNELLKEIKELPEFIEYRDAIRTQHNHPFSIEYMRTFEAEDKLISAILLKCHQSEAAEIAELRAEVIECNNEIETLTDFKVRSMDEYEKADAEIAELKAKIERLERK